MNYMLAIDIGASSGRLFLGHTKNGQLFTEEVYRFDNAPLKTPAGLVWDTELLFREILTGLIRCKELGKCPSILAIDTWGVDYALLDSSGALLPPVFSYRDPARKNAAQAVDEQISPAALYARTGIQRQDFNTIFQLYADKCGGKLDQATRFLQLPDYLAYRLTGRTVNEYTNATTTSLINVESKTWDQEILHTLGIDTSLFTDPIQPGEPIGTFSDEIVRKVGYRAMVIAGPTHDTAAAFAAACGEPHSVCISSGTWSLIGMERSSPVMSEEARLANFTNEGGLGGQYRFLKNIMGMWLIQSIRRDTEKRYTYEEMMHLAMTGHCYQPIPVNDAAFAAPSDMCQAIRSYLKAPSLSLADILATVYHSMALHYRKAVEEIEAITHEPIEQIRIVGGGSADVYLNQLTEKTLGKKVYAGPKEATIYGNLACQIMYLEHKTLAEARTILRASFNTAVKIGI